MPNPFASGRNSWGLCDRCSFRYKLKELRSLTIKTKSTNILVCSTCWEPDHPQLLLGMFPVNDPQALRNPRPDSSYWQAGYTGLQVDVINPVNPQAQLSYGVPSDGSRVIQWGWAPVGLYNPLDLSGLVSTLQANGDVGDVTVSTT